ncbi:MAG: phosphotransferase [Firmicutes bacterium]|nr:phosphotransferase [Bacillota bacterium]
MLSQKEFQVLKTLAGTVGSGTQRDLAETTGCSLGTVNKIIQSFLKEAYIDDHYRLLPAGRQVLEQFRVENAVILAAGMTSGTNAIARSIPKGLYVVKGEVLIERLIRQLQEAGIPHIYVVVGFRMDQFFYLEEKFGVHLIANPNYASRNNNASLRCAQKLLGNSYIIPNDEYFTENVFSPYEYDSFYAAVHSASKSKETFLKLDAGDRIVGVYKGGNAGWVMLGHSYMTRAYAEQYRKWMDQEFDRYETRKLFWEEIFYPHLREMPLYAKKYPDGVIYEFDELGELQGFDDQFINNINPEIYDLICGIFHSTKSEITHIRPMKEDQTDIWFRFKVRNDDFVFRYPGRESAALFDFDAERTHSRIAREWGVDDSFLFEDRRGYRITENTREIPSLDGQRCVSLLKNLQENTASPAGSFDFREQIQALYDRFDDNQTMRASCFGDLKEKIDGLLTLIGKDNWDKRFSHNHITREKIRLCGSEYALVDWRFSGVNDIGYDIAALACVLSGEDELQDAVIAEFLEPTPEVRRHLYACRAVYGFHAFLLGIYYSNSENEFSNNLYRNWCLTRRFVRKAEELLSGRRSQYLTDGQAAYVEEKLGQRIASLEPLSGGVTNLTYALCTESGKKYALRVPGKGTNEYINRADEMANIAVANTLGIMPYVTCADPETGILIMDFIENSVACSMEDVYHDASLERICRTLHQVHTSGKTFRNEFDIPKMQKMYREHFRELGGNAPKPLRREEKRMDEWMDYLFREYPKELVTCHIDPKLNNFLKKGNRIFLIDWEYSGMADLYFELANFALTNNLSEEEEKRFLDCYFRVSGIPFRREKYLLYKFVTDYLWIYWHLIKCQENSMVEYNEMSWKKRLMRGKAVLDLLEKERV